ncbi:killer cell lectin-like receptor subfamily G member 1 isoform X2 [Rhinatrema bivittatum]|uniref:killer cell lectin-like receptor subfamily G member 1 isoform X2 n=1 Tax=Rhinatrema bivittatum TaxID=194408 RepID=UPI00112B29EE|nr:killer cell lectin-like receptor subfamily G member 1 isoform X2 [Rhinatrema bivittatum]
MRYTEGAPPAGQTGVQHSPNESAHKEAVHADVSRGGGCRICAIVLGVVLLLQTGALISLIALRIPINCSGLTQTCQHSNLSIQQDQLLLEKMEDYLCGEVKEGSPCDFCTYGWLLSHGRCYYFSEEERDWQYSLGDCRSRNSQLLTLHEDSEMELVDRRGDDFFWIGLQYNGSLGTWFWTDGSSMLQNTRIKVSAGGSGYSCGVYRNGKFHAAQCRSAHRWICKRMAVRLPLHGGQPSALEK